MKNLMKKVSDLLWEIRNYRKLREPVFLRNTFAEPAQISFPLWGAGSGIWADPEKEFSGSGDPDQLLRELGIE